MEYTIERPLDQVKLNVAKKKRSNLFNWRGQFTPEFVEYLLTTFGKKNKVVLDPFAGSGTVINEAAKLGMQAYGIELNPASYTMSRFYCLGTLTIDERFKLINSVKQLLSNQIVPYGNLPVYVSNKDYREAYKNLLGFTKFVYQAANSVEEKIFLLNLLFFVEKDRRSSIKESLIKNLQRLKIALLALPSITENAISIFLNDARRADRLIDQKVDLIVTSPPYINVFNYHQNYRGLIESIGFDILAVAKSEVGSNRKNRGNRFRTVVQYSLEMEQTLCSIGNITKKDGKVVLVVGRTSNVRKVPFSNSEIVTDLISNLDMYQLVQSAERSFTNKFGKTIYEDIIVARKIIHNQGSSKPAGADIALKHLKYGLDFANTLDDKTIKADIEDAINNISSIQPSSMVNLKAVLPNE